MSRFREYVCHKEVAAKLERTMNAMDAAGFDEIAPVFQGGRDWIIVASRDFNQSAPAHEFGDAGIEAERLRKIEAEKLRNGTVIVD